MLKWTSRGTLNDDQNLGNDSFQTEAKEHPLAVPSTDFKIAMEDRQPKVNSYSENYTLSPSDKSAVYDRRYSLNLAPNSPVSIAHANKILGTRARSMSLPSSPQKSESKESTTKKKGVITKFKNLFRRTSTKTKDQYASSQPSSPKLSIGLPSPSIFRKPTKEPKTTETTRNDLVLPKQNMPKTRLTRLIEAKRDQRKLNKGEKKTKDTMQTQPLTTHSSTSSDSMEDCKGHGGTGLNQQLEDEGIDHFLSPGQGFYQIDGHQLPLKTAESATRSKDMRYSYSTTPGLETLQETQNRSDRERTGMAPRSPKDHIFNKGKKRPESTHLSEARDKRWSTQSDSQISTNISHDYNLKSTQESSFHRKETGSKFADSIKPAAVELSTVENEISPPLDKSYGSDLSLIEYERSLVAMLESGSLEKVKVMPSNSDKILKARSQLLPTASNLPHVVDSSTPESNGKTGDLAMGRGKYRWSVVDDDRLVISPIQSQDHITREDGKADSSATSATSVARNNNNGIYHSQAQKSKTAMLDMESNMEVSFENKSTKVDRAFQDWNWKYEMKQTPIGVNKQRGSTIVEGEDVQVDSSSRPCVKDIVNTLEKEFEINVKRESPEAADHSVKAKFPFQKADVDGDKTQGMCKRENTREGDMASESSLRLQMPWMKKDDHNAHSLSAWTDSDGGLNSAESAALSLVLENVSPHQQPDSTFKELVSAITEDTFHCTLTDSQSDSSVDLLKQGKTLKKVHKSGSSWPGYESESFTNGSDTNALYSDDSEFDSSVCNFNLADNEADSSWDDNMQQRMLKARDTNNTKEMKNLERKSGGILCTEKHFQEDQKCKEQSQDSGANIFKETGVEDQEEGITDVKEPNFMLKEDSSLLNIALEVTADILHLQRLCPTIDRRTNDLQEENSNIQMEMLQNENKSDSMEKGASDRCVSNYDPNMSSAHSAAPRLNTGLADDASIFLLKSKKNVTFKLDVRSPDESSASEDMALIETVPVIQLGAMAQTKETAFLVDDNTSLTDVSSSLSAKSNDGQAVTSQITSASVDDVSWLAQDAVEEMDFYHDHCIRGKSLISESNLTQPIASSESGGTQKLSKAENTVQNNAFPPKILTLSSFLSSKKENSPVFEISTLQVHAKRQEMDTADKNISSEDKKVLVYSAFSETGCDNESQNVTKERQEIVKNEVIIDQKENWHGGKRQHNISGGKKGKPEQPEHVHKKQEAVASLIEITKSSLPKTYVHRDVYDKKETALRGGCKDEDDSLSVADSHTYNIVHDKGENRQESLALQDRPSTPADLDDSLDNLEIDNDESSNISECVKQIMTSPPLKSPNSRQQITNAPFWKKSKTKYSKFDGMKSHTMLSGKGGSNSGKDILAPASRSKVNEKEKKSNEDVNMLTCVQSVGEKTMAVKKGEITETAVDLKSETLIAKAADERDRCMSENNHQDQQFSQLHEKKSETKLHIKDIETPVDVKTSENSKDATQCSEEIKVLGAENRQKQPQRQSKEFNYSQSGGSFGNSSEGEIVETYIKCKEISPLLVASDGSDTSANTRGTDLSDTEGLQFITDPVKSFFQTQDYLYHTECKLVSDSSSFESHDIHNDMEFKMRQGCLGNPDIRSTVMVKNQMNYQMAGLQAEDIAAQFMNRNLEFKTMSRFSDDGSGDCWESVEDSSFESQHDTIDKKNVKDPHKQRTNCSKAQIRPSLEITPEIQNEFVSKGLGNKKNKPPDVKPTQTVTKDPLRLANSFVDYHKDKSNAKYSVSSDSSHSHGLTRYHGHDHENNTYFNNFQGTIPRQHHQHNGKRQKRAGKKGGCLCECQPHSTKAFWTERKQKVNLQSRKQCYQELGDQKQRKHPRCTRYQEHHQYDQNQQIEPSLPQSNDNQMNVQQNQQMQQSGVHTYWNMNRDGSQRSNGPSSMSGASSSSKSKLESKPGEWLFIATFFVFQLLMHWLYSR